MKVLVVIGSQINAFPPVRNLVEILIRNGHKVTVLARDNTGLFINAQKNYEFIVIPEPDPKRPSPIEYRKKQQFMRRVVKEEMKHHDILWTATDATVRDLGDVVLKYKHVMQLMELIRDIPFIPGQKLIPLNIKRYAQQAYKVVVPEYNRANIQQTWWDLKKRPTILPNKMSMPSFDAVDIPEDVQKILDEIDNEKKKIILYQGVFHEDRELETFIQATETMKNEYQIYLMGTDTPYRQKLSKTFPDVKYVSFIKPPFHLLVTKRAHIGLLPYKAAPYLHYAKINALYCAPNKIFEYSAYGVPMLGTDVPGLHEPFSTYNIGLTCEPLTADKIARNIREIERNYATMSDNCHDFYDSVDMDKIVEAILMD